MALQVIGAGLGRTGTMSLKLALEHVGFGPCYHMTEVLVQARRNIPLWLEVIRGKPDWDQVFAGFAASSDYPACSYWRELAAYYPQAKVILTVRDADGWFDSVNRTIFAEGGPTSTAEGPMAEFMQGALIGDFAEHIRDRAFMTAYFERRNAEVIAALPPERLLVHRPGDGWEPLCRFLGVPVPAEPYPQVNTSEEWARDKTFKDEESVASPEIAEERGRTFIAAMRQRAFGGPV
jgi:hypothetical protein